MKHDMYMYVIFMCLTKLGTTATTMRRNVFKVLAQRINHLFSLSINCSE